MEHTTNRTFICSVVFVDIVNYSQQPVDEQIQLKNRFNAILSEAIKDVAVNDRIILDTGDGAAISFLGDPEDALFVALSIRDAIISDSGADQPSLSARLGINLGPVKLVQDINCQRNLIGDGINVAQRVMSFSKPGQVLVSRSYFEVISRLSQEYAKLFHYEGSRADKHVREHQVYSVCPPEMENEKPPAPPEPCKEKKRKEIITDRAIPPAADASGAGEGGNTPEAGATQPVQPLRESGPPVWKKLFGGVSAMWLGVTKALREWSIKGMECIKTLIRRGIRSVDWNDVRNNKAFLYVAISLIVILIGVPVIVWRTGGTPGKDLGTVSSASSIATSDSVKKTETTGKAKNVETAVAPADLKKAEAETPVAPEKTISPATVTLGIAPWGEVYVDGKKRGVSPPLNMMQVAPGKHEIEIRNTTFVSYKQTVDLKSGEQLKIKHKFR